MSPQIQKMTTEENQESQNSSTETNDLPSELVESCWSVITFDAVAVSNLSYDEAVGWLEKLHQQKVSGLCIITDEAAARFSK